MLRKYLFTGLLLAGMMMALIGCSSDKTVDADVENPVEDQSQEELQDASVDVDTDTDAEVDTEVDNEETPDEDSETVDENVEMVDWETWATQADNDEVCLVVWNENTSTQKILEPMPEGETDVKKYSYTVEEGDRFAVPRRDNIVYVDINRERLSWDYLADQKYMELELEPGEVTQISIICSDIDWAITYLFNF